MIITQRYIYPPRPEKTPVPRSSLAAYQQAGYVGQLKYNDQHTMFSIVPNTGGDPDIIIYGRHGELRKNYSLPDYLKREILDFCDRLGLDRSKWHYLDGGILHHKSKTFSDTVVIWDILVANGDWLLGSTYISRYNRLLEAAGNRPWEITVGDQQFDIGLKAGDHILVPKVYADYDEAWRLVDAVNKAAGWKGEGEPSLEGVVIKYPKATLGITVNDTQACGWMTRSRVMTGRHRY